MRKARTRKSTREVAVPVVDADAAVEAWTPPAAPLAYTRADLVARVADPIQEYQPAAVELYRIRGVEIAKRDGVRVPFYRTGDEAVLRDMDFALRIARDQYMNSQTYQAIINRLVVYILGVDGVEVRLNTDDQALRAKFNRLWSRWCRSPETTGRFTFTEFEKRMVVELLVSGVLLLVKCPGPKLQIIEREFIKKINTNEATGEIVSFTVKLPGDKRPRTIAAAKCIFVSSVQRYSQYWGTGVLWVSSPWIMLLEFVQNISGRAWGAAASHALTVNVADPVGWRKNAASPGGPPGVYDVNGIKYFVAQPGQTLAPVDQNKIPNSQFDAHCFTFLKYICAPTGTNPYHLLNDYSQQTYAGDKSARLAKQSIVGSAQTQMKRVYHKVLWWLAGGWMADGELSAAHALDVLEMIEPELPVITQSDPRQQAEADRAQLEIGTKTLPGILREQNQDPEEHRRERVRAITNAIDDAKEIERLTGVAVAWEPLAGIGAAGSMAPTAPAEIPAPATKPEEPAA